MSDNVLDQIQCNVIEDNASYPRYHLSYELDGREYTADFMDLLELTDPQGRNFYYKSNRKTIHFFDVSNCDLNFIMGLCAILYYEKPVLSTWCGNFDPCLYMGFRINDSWGIYPELQNETVFMQCRYILKLFLEMGYAKKHELIIKDYNELCAAKIDDKYKSDELEIWPPYTKQEPGTIGLLCIDQSFKKDKLLLRKIDCYFEALWHEWSVIDDKCDNNFNIYDDNGFKNPKFYFLQDETDHTYLSFAPGQFGGHNKLKIYGQLDCPSALRYIQMGKYVRHRVFFKDQETAVKAGYRPCGVCMKAEYKKWKETQHK